MEIPNAESNHALRSAEQKTTAEILAEGSKCLKYALRNMMRKVKDALIDVKKKYDSKAIENLTKPPSVEKDEGRMKEQALAIKSLLTKTKTVTTFESRERLENKTSHSLK